MELKNKTVLVTGSSRGIGQAIALAFGQAGCNVVLNGSQNKEALEKTEELFLKANLPVLSVFTDVSEYANCISMFETIRRRFGDVDILVNNAGISHISLFSDMTPDQWQRVMEVNFNSVLNCTHLAVPSMVRKKEGIILNISSIWGEVGASCESVYAASKGAINAFTKSMAKELGPSGIRVNALACGVIDTQMNSGFTQEETAALTESIPLSRLGKTTEVADLALFLAHSRSAYLTGQVILLDGGMCG